MGGTEVRDSPVGLDVVGLFHRILDYNCACFVDAGQKILHKHLQKELQVTCKVILSILAISVGLFIYYFHVCVCRGKALACALKMHI